MLIILLFGSLEKKIERVKKESEIKKKKMGIALPASHTANAAGFITTFSGIREARTLSALCGSL